MLVEAIHCCAVPGPVPFRLRLRSRAVRQPEAPQSRRQKPRHLEAPLKTIQAALDKAQPGDSVEVRGGVYHEGVSFKRGGSISNSGGIWWNLNSVKWLTLEAYKDEPVVLDGSLVIRADKWERLKDRKNTYRASFVGERGTGSRDGLAG